MTTAARLHPVVAVPAPAGPAPWCAECHPGLPHPGGGRRARHAQRARRAHGLPALPLVGGRRLAPGAGVAGSGRVHGVSRGSSPGALCRRTSWRPCARRRRRDGAVSSAARAAPVVTGRETSALSCAPARRRRAWRRSGASRIISRWPPARSGISRGSSDREGRVRSRRGAPLSALTPVLIAAIAGLLPAPRPIAPLRCAFPRARSSRCARPARSRSVSRPTWCSPTIACMSWTISTGGSPCSISRGAVSGRSRFPALKTPRGSASASVAPTSSFWPPRATGASSSWISRASRCANSRPATRGRPRVPRGSWSRGGVASSRTTAPTRSGFSRSMAGSRPPGAVSARARRSFARLSASLRTASAGCW